jgi:3-isopropylmalate/(R)-2-methylmalate dehydratase small subunit
MKFQSRVWKFGDNINTDLILPIQAFYLTPAEQAQWVFRANRPGWAEQVKAGDIIIGGRNFGMGSSRPAARSLKNLGLACLVAQSINGLFFRNCVNFAFPAIECADAFDAFEEGDVAEVDFDAATVRNVMRGKSFAAVALPPKLLDLLKAGGIFALLEKDGAIGPKTAISG